MKKQAKAFLSMLLAAAVLLAGCHSMVEEGLETKHISATFYPIYALALNIVKDVPGLSLTCLVQPQDGCMRDYELSDWDFSVLAGQDLVLLGGRGLEMFEGALHYLHGEPILISCMEGLRLREGLEGEAAEAYERIMLDNARQAREALERAR